MKLIKLVMIFLIVNGCAHVDIPLVTFTQLDTKHNQANPKRVTKYNDQTCKIETVREPSFQIILEDGSINPIFHGGFFISYDDMNKLIDCGTKECRKELDRIIELQRKQQHEKQQRDPSRN